MSSELIQPGPMQQTLPDIPAPSVATPAQLLEIAVRQDADIDKLERLMVLQERWETNEARKAFVAARSRLREELPNITRDGTVAHGNTRYQHATLGGTLRQIRPALTNHGFDVSWRTSVGEGNAIIVTCILTHSGGHSEDTAMVAQPDTSGSKNSIQAQGSTVTYLERYTLFALLGLASGEDDDGGAATPPPAAPSDALLATAQDVAEQGTEALRDWYKAQTPADRAALKPALPRLKERAAEVLREADSGAA